MQDHEWFRDHIHTIFGDGGQSALARFLSSAGDARSLETILRSINNAATGRSRLSGEMRVLMFVLRHHAKIPELLRNAAGQAEAPLFQLLPKPAKSAAPARRKSLPPNK